MSKVTVEIDAKWMKIVRSPFYWIVATFQGVAITFAPLFLYWSGRNHVFSRSEWIIVPVCFALILLVGLFYIRLGNEIAGELRKRHL